MKLESFRVQNYRSVHDSGKIVVSRMTALMRRNESGKTLRLNANIPRIAKRIEAGLGDLEIPFHKTRPTRLSLKKMTLEPEKMVPDQSLERFEALFALINGRLEKQVTRILKPFEG